MGRLPSNYILPNCRGLQACYERSNRIQAPRTHMYPFMYPCTAVSNGFQTAKFAPERTWKKTASPCPQSGFGQVTLRVRGRVGSDAASCRICVRSLRTSCLRVGHPIAAHEIGSRQNWTVQQLRASGVKAPRDICRALNLTSLQSSNDYDGTSTEEEGTFGLG